MNGGYGPWFTVHSQQKLPWTVDRGLWAQQLLNVFSKFQYNFFSTGMMQNHPLKQTNGR